MTFYEIKPKIKNLGNFTSLKEIKEAGLRICRNTKTGDYWLIEEEFLKPVIKSPRECKSILIKPEDLKYKVFMCHKSKQELKDTKALEYIEWGEKVEIQIKQGSKKNEKIIGYQNLETIKGRKYWWDLRTKTALIKIPMFFRKRYFSVSAVSCLTDAQLYDVFCEKDIMDRMIISLNSYLTLFFIELLGRGYGGGGGPLKLQVYETQNITILNPMLISQNFRLFDKKIRDIFSELGFDKNKPIRSQQPNPLPDRKELDDIIFDELGLTKEERKKVYWAVAELVKNRLDKAGSFNAH